ncbi:MAG: hypothetical protein VKK04_01585 [Synechococcales bacterium]|nr:hypothetical protein [Synechococcales bacterium]
MTVFATADLQNLVEAQHQPCVSIYLPTHKAGPETRQDPIRLKDLTRQAQQQLVQLGLREDDARQLLMPASNLVQAGDGEFWRHQSHGLALFITPEGMQEYRLPESFEEQVVVGDRFYLKPLLPLLQNNGRFFLLALSQGAVRLYLASRDAIAPVPLEDLPANLEDALKYDQKEAQLRFHREARNHTPIRHGQGVGTGGEEKKDEIRRYCQIVDRTLQKHLHLENMPMVLAGVEYVLDIYRDSSTYPHLVEEQITGKVDPEGGMDDEELHQRAWEIMKPRFAATQRQTVETFGSFQGTGQATNRIQDIVLAAYRGQVDTLFVATHAHQWGTVDPDASKVTLTEQQSPKTLDLLDIAAIHTVLNGGTVYAVAADQIPGTGHAAAIFRYPLLSNQVSAASPGLE